MTRKPTICEVLAARLERPPTHREQCEEVKRILQEAARERAAQGKLKHQKGV